MKMKNPLNFGEDEYAPDKGEDQVLKSEHPCSNLDDPLVDFYAKEKMVSGLITELHKLTPHRDWAKARAEEHEQHNKKYRYAWMSMASKETSML